MPGTADLDPREILAHIGVTDATDAQPVSGGQDTALWRVLWRGQAYALRVFRPEQAETCSREVAMMRCATSAAIPVPDVVRVGRWENRPVLLLSWLAGQPLFDQFRSQPHRLWSLGRAFGRMQAEIHRAAVPPAGDATGWIEWAGDEPALKSRLYALPTRSVALLHLDYHPLNVMAQGGRITGVLDWANARFGDPRADVARTVSILRIAPYGPHADSWPLRLVRRLIEQAWRSGYVQAGGRLDDMALFYAWAGAVMIRDLSLRVGRPGSWLESKHLDGVRDWRDRWMRCSGLIP